MKKQISTAGIEITGHCNLNCIHCYQGNEKKIFHVPKEKILYILNKIVPYNPRFVVLTGGEPLIHPDIYNILDNIGQKYPNIDFVIATNGTLVNEKIIKKLKKYQNISIQISLDGATKGTHEKQHDSGTFEKIMATLQLLSAIPRERKSLQMTISKINYRECLEVAQIALNNNFFVKFQYICIVGNAKVHQNELELTAAQQISTYLKIEQYSKKNPHLGITAPKSMLSCSFEHPETPIAFNINLDGNITTCTCLDSKFFIGNIFNNSMDELLNSPMISDISNRVITRNKILRESVCKKCIVCDQCGQGCIGRAINLGNELGLDGECQFRKSLLVFNKTMKLAYKKSNLET